MLDAYLRFLPARTRGLIIVYSRPTLVDWNIPDDQLEELHREEQFGLITRVRGLKTIDSWAMVGKVPFAQISSTRDWYVTSLKLPPMFVGITKREFFWSRQIDSDNPSLCIEPCFSLKDGTTFFLALREVDFSGTSPRYFDAVGSVVPVRLAECGIMALGRRFHFRVDISCNLFSVSFDDDRIHVDAIIPDLASYRPFCYFLNGPSPRCVVSFL